MTYRSKIELLNIDCLPFMKQCKDSQFDLAIVDPPYGIGAAKQIDLGNSNRKQKHKTKDWDDGIPSAEYFAELLRVSKNQIIWGGNYFLDYLGATRCFLIWDKQNGTNNISDAELAWTSFETSVRMYRGHIFKGIGNTNYNPIHPTQKPVKLYEWILHKYARPGQVILDSHLGSASIAVACDKMGYDLVGLEIDKEYFDKATKRLKQHRSQMMIF